MSSSKSPLISRSVEDPRSPSTHKFNHDLNPAPFPASTSLLTARRPSWTPALPPTFDFPHQRRVKQQGPASLHDVQGIGSLQAPNIEPSSPEDGGNFRRSLQIDMKGLVGDAVGNMSISPASRDIVLAARRGLFIIDLEAPLEVPRFLPQGGTWDVADVQWNPHPSRAEYIVSTSSEKLLIWNLLLVGKTSIEHILQSHYRAITDINWHTTECDTVVSTGIDSWLWAWDLREPRKPIFGLSAFNAGGTQVKWNRQDPNILASSHSNQVLIWDRRKGSLPVSRIQAHNSKIYGIDWSHNLRNEIVTCSLDKTIKVWNIHAAEEKEPKTTIRTTYPVWRARDLPFGQGVLSLAQRGETALEMYSTTTPQDELPLPVETFEGHTDVIKEFVWRKGGQDGTEFQLITWSKDRTLRFWPVDTETMQKVGHVHVPGMHRPPTNNENNISFRNPPEGTEYLPTLSAPVGHRSILAEVRASLPPRQQNPVLQPHQGSALRASHENLSLQIDTNKPVAPRPMIGTTPIMTGTRRGGTMSRGNFGGKSVATMDAFTWLSNVKVGGRRGSSSGPGSGADSADASRLSSRSRPPSGPDRQTNNIERRGSDSANREEKREVEGSQSLQDEITSVLTKLASSKIKLEKHDLTKKRTCTLGLHGPWGESSSVFIRVSFTFPRDYPQGSHPYGTPVVELERNPLISIRNRASILRRLRAIRERRRPCLEACLRFLLFANEDEQAGMPLSMDSESSSEDEYPSSRKSRDFTVALLRNHKNLAEPRTSQGVFGPNGELVCFFRAPPRIVRNILRDLSVSPAKPAQNTQDAQNVERVPRLFQSPALLSDAVRRLGLAATDRLVKSVDLKRADDGDNILRIMTNLLTFSQQKLRRDSESKPLGEIPKSYALLPTRRSTVYIANTTDIAGADRKVAVDYVFVANSLADVCDKNALVAREHGRYDHERVFKTLRTLFPASGQDDGSGAGSLWAACDTNSMIHGIVTRLYAEFSKCKDIQMLAMASVILLQASRISTTLRICEKTPDSRYVGGSPVVSTTPKFGGVDYFSLARPKGGHISPLFPSWPRLPSSPTAPPTAPSLSSSNSSRGSWSSLFNTGTMRQFMSGVQDSLKEGLTTPSEILPGNTSAGGSIPVPRGDRILRGPDSPVPRRRGYWRDPSMQLPSAVSKSWNEAPPSSAKAGLSFSSAGHRRPTFSQVIGPKNAIAEKRVLVFDEPRHTTRPVPMLEPGLTEQLVCHVHVYAEMLFGWQLFHKRLELLKSVNRDLVTHDIPQHTLGLVRTCTRCNNDLRQNENACSSCGNPSSMPHCSICRLPVKGLSRSCLRCLHVSHISCWKTVDLHICATGCGCLCTGFVLDQTRSSTWLAKSPRYTTSILSSPIA